MDVDIIKIVKTRYQTQIYRDAIPQHSDMQAEKYNSVLHLFKCFLLEEAFNNNFLNEVTRFTTLVNLFNTERSNQSNTAIPRRRIYCGNKNAA